MRGKFVQLVRNSNSAAVNIPRAYITHLAWYTGEPLVVELHGDNAILIRRPEPRDLPHSPIAAALPVAPESTK